MTAPVAVFAARRLVGVAVTLLLTSLVIFLSVHAAPGDPASFLLQGRSATPQAMAAIREQYHLDQPVLSQFGTWLAGIPQGDFGSSIQFRQDVGGLLAARLPTTLLLLAMAATLMLLFGISLGIWSALRPGLIDKVVLMGSTLAVATPTFIAAVALIGIFAVQLGWFPTFGSG